MEQAVCRSLAYRLTSGAVMGGKGAWGMSQGLRPRAEDHFFFKENFPVFFWACTRVQILYILMVHLCVFTICLRDP